MEFEVLNRFWARGLDPTKLASVRRLIAGVAFIELTPKVLDRARRPFPVAVRTLDSLHLATMDFLRGEGQSIRLASYDKRLTAGADAIGIPIETGI